MFFYVQKRRNLLKKKRSGVFFYITTPELVKEKFRYFFFIDYDTEPTPIGSARSTRLGSNERSEPIESLPSLTVRNTI